ncbi:MAG TPA: DUF930 domain-containing protein [Hyphomicrobium sp.]|jgi:hypothetical protein|nr:DUF930 domain-containing protein [Hyphomicrobium sp.]
MLAIARDGGNHQEMRGAGSLYLKLFIVGAAIAGSHTAFADASMDRVLQKLEPEERAHQACSLRGLEAIRKGTHLKGIDRLKTSSRNQATFKDNVVTANGAAVRAKHRWYALQYKCTVTDDQMKAKTFDFKIGAEIPEDQWEDFGLWK